MPLGRNLSERGGDGGEDGVWGLWPWHLGRPMRGCGWAGRREASEVSSWPLPLIRALINPLLSSPSEDGGMEEQDNKQINKQTGKDHCFPEIYRNICFIRPVMTKTDK